MSGFKVPFIKPSLPSSAEIARDFDEIVESNWFTNFGPKERQFRKALEDYLGQDLNVETFANGTLALLAAVYCVFGRGEADRHLLMPSFTFAAVPQAAIWSGYKPWFIDIDPVTWQADPQFARDVLEGQRGQVAGIVLPNVSGVGNPRIAEWERLAQEWDLSIVIDSAAGFGSRYEDGQHLGARGSCEIFSFHATKPFAIGEGGALASRDERITNSAHNFQNFGFNSARLCDDLGINAKLSEINAAIGLRQLVDLDSRLDSRRRTFDRYRAELEPLGFAFQQNARSSSSQCANVCCTSPAQKISVLNALQGAGVEARDYYNPPLHLHPYFAAAPEFSALMDLSVTENLCSRIVSLPIHENMPADHVDLVLDAVKKGASASL